MKEIIHQMTAWVTHWAATPYGAWALFAIAFAESSFFPIPPDALLIALCLVQPETSFYFALICSVGSTLGGMFGYFIGLKGGRPLLMKLFKSEKIKLVESQFKKWDVWAVGTAGFTPIPFKLFTISAGVFDLDFPRFVLTSMISRSARFFMVGALFYFFGQSIQAFIMKYFEVLTLSFLVLLVLGFWVVGLLGKRAARKNS
ncbi:MAG: YqaA family protein [Pseudomonadota bacterium]